MAAFGVPQAHEDDAYERRARRSPCAMPSTALELRGADRHRGRRGRRRRGRLDVRDRRGGEPRRAAAAGRAAGRDPHRPDGPSARGRQHRRRGCRPARAEGHGRRSPGLAVDRRARRPGAAARHAGAARRPRRRARAPREHLQRAPCATAAPTSSRSTASPASARADSRGSSSTASSARACSSGARLPYGEGVTYWPLGEMIKAAAGIADDDPLEEAFEKLRACCADDAVADVLGLASGLLEALDGRAQPAGDRVGRARGDAAHRGRSAD